MKVGKTVTLDEEIIALLLNNAQKNHIDFSARLNQILHEYFNTDKKKKILLLNKDM